MTDRGSRQLGLVLSGGGALGAFEVGVMSAVEQAGHRPTVFSGTSAGALNAAGAAAGLDAAQLADLWTSVSSSDVFRVRKDLWRLPRWRGMWGRGALPAKLLNSVGWTWLMRTDPLRATLERMLGGTRVGVRGDMVAVVSAVEIGSGKLVRYCSQLPPKHRRTSKYRQVDLGVDHLMASASIPLLFRPGEAEGVTHWDGGMVANTPLAPAMAYEPDAVVVVTTATRERPAPDPSSITEAINLLIENVMAFSLHSDLARAEEINRACRGGRDDEGRRQVDLLLVEPTGLDMGSTLDFDPTSAAERIRMGEELGRKALADWDVDA